MITNQTMEVDVLGQILKVEHKTWMGSLTDLFNIGNGERIKEGLPCTNVHSFLRSDRIKAFIKDAESEWGISSEQVIQIRGKGRNIKTWAHLSVLIAAAEYLSPKVHHKVIREFIEGRLLQFRDSSGDAYKSLKEKISLHLPEYAVGSQLIMEVATEFRNKINPPGDKGWNLATAKQLQQRDELEKYLCQNIKRGFIKDKNQLIFAIKEYEFDLA